MKKVIISILTATLILSSNCVGAFANESTNEKNTLVGYVEDTPIDNQFGEKQYSLDFSCLDVSKNGKKLNVKVNKNRIDKISKDKNFNKEKKVKLTDSANKTKEILETQLTDEKIQSEINEIIQQHNAQTSSNPIIGFTEVASNSQAAKTALDEFGVPFISPLADGNTESNSYVRLYTSVSGSGTTAWGQSNAYIPTPSTIGLQRNLPDAISLSWDSPWKLTDNYSISIVNNFGTTLPPYLKARTRTGGSNSCLAYSYVQESVQGVYLGASLANGSSGGHNLFSNYIHTYAGVSFSFSASGGKTGVSVSPTTGTNSVQSSVYFTR
jgi:hypothetical protein